MQLQVIIYNSFIYFWKFLPDLSYFYVLNIILLKLQMHRILPGDLRLLRSLTLEIRLTGDTRKIFVSNIRPSTSLTRRAS